MTVIHTFHTLSRLERRALLQALCTVLTVRIALWVLPARTIISKVRQLAERPANATVSKLPSETIVWGILAASRRVPRASCLTQAVSGLYLLGRHGWPARLCLGVAPGEKGGIRAHAWLERDGAFLLGEGPGFTRMPDFPGQQSESHGRPA